MRKKNKKLILGGVVITLVLVVLGVINAAASSVSLVVSPPTQKMILAPGDKYTNSIVVSNANNSTKDLKYTVHIGSYSESKGENSKDDYGDVDVVSVSSYNQMMEWITFDKKSGTVAPNKKDVVTYTINVPEDAPAGGQYASVIIRDDTDSDKDSNGNVAIKSNFQFATILYAEVTGATRKEGEIIDNSMPSFLLNGPLTAEAMVKNNGNVHTDAEFTLQVWPLFSDEELCTNEEEPGTSLILPDTERYHAQTCDLPSFGIFNAKQVVKIFDKTSIVERTVIICPLWLLFMILFVIITLVIWIFMKAGKRKSSRKDDE